MSSVADTVTDAVGEPAEHTAQYLEHYAASAGRLCGRDLAWLRDAREQALERFRTVGFPTTRDEDWKYTRVTALSKRTFAPAQETATGIETESHLLAGDGPRAVFVDGIMDHAASRLDALAEGISVMTLAEAFAKAPDTLREHVERHGAAVCDGFSALNAALTDTGLFVHLAPGAKMDRPLEILFLASGEREVSAHPRILIVAEAGAEGAVLEHFMRAADGSYFNNAATEVVVGEGARVEHYKVQRESARAFHIATLRARVAADGTFVSHAVALGALLSRCGIDVSLDAPGASCALNGLYMVGGRQHVDFHTRVDHREPHGTSDEYYKGILDGRSRGVFNGQVYVHPGADKTDARQNNRNILLSRDAEVDTKPQLEIYADDVACAHGATVGQLDDEMLFYLRSRGIGEATARSLLVYGFARDVIERIAFEPLRDRLTEILLDRVPDAAHLREVLQ